MTYQHAPQLRVVLEACRMIIPWNRARPEIWSGNFLHFMEPEGSLPCIEPFTVPYR